MIIPDLTHEREYWQQGMRVVAGVDEVGRGAWAGPVVAAAVCISSEADEQAELPALLRDSKKLSPAQRAKVVGEIKDWAESWAIGQASVDEINSMGIGPANYLAMRRAVLGLPQSPEQIIVDGLAIPELNIPQQPVIKGDATVASVSTASIVAKVYRDELLAAMEAVYPGYGWASHKGYGTAAHRKAILKLGLSPVHRTGYKLKFLV